MARQPAGARPAVRQPVLPEEGDRPRHHRHAASGAAGASGRPSSRRRSTTRSRPTMRTSSSRAMPSSRRTRPACAGRPRRAVQWTHSRSAEGSAPMSSQSGTRGHGRSRRDRSRRVAGCSEMYYDRRETVSLGAGDAVATNKVAQMVDPWPRYERQQQHRLQRPAHAGGARIATTAARSSRRCIADRKRRRTTSRCSGGGELAVGDRPVHARRRRRRRSRVPAATATLIACARCASGYGVSDAMRIGRSSSHAGKTQVVVLTADPAFEEQARATFGASPQIALERRLRHASTSPAMRSRLADATVAVIDLDASMPGEMQALERLMARIGAWPPVIVVTQSFDATVARTLLQMRVADFHGQAGVAGRAGAHLRPRRQERDGRRGGDRVRDLHVPARGRRRRRHYAGGADAR